LFGWDLFNGFFLLKEEVEWFRLWVMVYFDYCGG
jgi:hypothetical protein